MSKCPKCGANIDLTEDKFCAKCGQEIIADSWECKSCGKINSSDYIFCIKCGTEKNASKLVDDNITKEPQNTSILVDDKTKEEPPNTSTSINEKTAKKPFNMKIIAGIFIVLAIVASVLYYQKVHNDAPAANNTKTEKHDNDTVWDDDDDKTTFRSVAFESIQLRSRFYPEISSIQLTEKKRIGDLYFKLPTNYPVIMQNTKLMMAGISEKEFIRVAILPKENFPTSDLGDLLARKTHSVEDVLRTFQKITSDAEYRPYAYVDFKMFEKINGICFIHLVAFRNPSEGIEFYKTDMFFTYHDNTAYLVEICDGTNEFDNYPRSKVLIAFLLSLSYENK